MTSDIKPVKQLFPEQCHKQIFLVGGCVRDNLLGRESRDIDLVAALPPVELGKSGFKLISGKSTAPIWFRHDEVLGTIELTLLDDIALLDDDLKRRDFTINAMAMNLQGELYDPLHGRSDLESGRLCACSEKTFSGDPLRIFRAFRFEAHGWQMSENTEVLIRNVDWAQAFKEIPVERFSREMLKALDSKNPERFFQRMWDFGVGTEYLPELFSMPQIPAGPLQYHPEGDLLTHSIQVLQRATGAVNDPLIRFCAFFHDIGKLSTNPALYPKHYGHDQAGFKAALSFCDRLRLPASYRTALAWVSRLHITINLWGQLRDSTRLRVAEQAIKAGITEVLPVVAEADKPGMVNLEEWLNTLLIAGMSAVELGIDKEKLESLPESKRKDYILQKRVKIMQQQK